jgi:putative serine protease PepD
MNENETDPRPTGASPEQASQEPASPVDGSPERGQSEQPTAAQPSAEAQAAAPQSAPPQSAIPQSALPQPAAPQSGSTQPLSVGQWSQPQSPWQQPTGEHPQQRPTVPMPYGQHPGYGAYQQPAYGQQPGYQQPGYQQQYAQQSAYAAWQQQQASAAGQPGVEGQSQPPSWVHPVGTDTQAPPRPARNRRIFVAGAAAVLIALGAGGVGAVTALAFDDNNGSPAIKTGNSSVTRVVDRSSLAAIASAVQDSVVSITTESGEGSGVILSADGYIVTNNHVVATATGKTVTVIFADGKKATATIVGTDTRDDLAVVKATGVSGLKAATFGSSSKMEVGDTVLAIGSPLGLEGSVTAGIISAKDRTIQSSSEDDQQQNPLGGSQQQGGTTGTSTTMSGLLQTDAPINPGNSGGALVNTNGEVIGINSAIATQGQGSGNIGLGFAIPSDKAASVAKDLMAGKQPAHPALGVSVADSENGGALVSTVTANSAAAKAGLQQGDVITAVDGKAINSADDLVAAIQGGTVGQKMTIDYTRNGAQKTASVTLAEAN